MRDHNAVLGRSGSRTNGRQTNYILDEIPEGVASRAHSHSPFLADASARPLPHRQPRTPDFSEFTSDQTHGFVQAENTDVSVTSDGLGWTSTYVSRQKENPYRRSFAARPDPLVGFALNGPVPLSRTVNGISLKKVMFPGSFSIIPAGADFDAKLDVPLESVHIYLRKGIVEEVGADLSKGDPARLEIIPQFAAFDPLLEQLAISIWEVAHEPPPSSALYVDYLGRAFAARLVQKHSSAPVQSVSPVSSQGLSQRQLKWVTEFVDANLSTPLSLADLARDSKLSPSHFGRLFRKSTGLTPYQYVMQRRIERAQRLLIGTTAPISQIAVDCGFAHQVHLTQAFRRLTGLTPAVFRKEHYR